MKGAAAMSVEMCAVTEISSAEGTAASTTQRAASRQVGARLGRCLRRRRVAAARERSISTPHQRDQRDQHDEQHGPAARLLAERGERLHHERIGEQREEAADIARRIEKIRVRGGRMIGAREPGLQQRAVGREREERQPDRHREQAEQPERRGRIGRRAAPPRGDRERQEQRRRDHHRRDARRSSACRADIWSARARRRSRRAARPGRTPSRPTTPRASRRASAAPSW